MTNPRFIFPDIPDTNWIRRYYQLKCENVRQSYPEYHFACGVGYIQQATGRKAYIALNGRKHFSNINHLLLGKTTLAGKTDAILPMREDFSILYPGKELPTDYSAAGLLEQLELMPDGYIIIDEAGTLFNRINNSKEAGAIRDIMCRIYDNDSSIWKQLTRRGKKDDGSIHIKDAFPTLVMGTTPQTFSKYSIGLDMTSGWLVRFLMYSPDHEKKFIPANFGYNREETDKELLTEYKKIRKMMAELHHLEFTPDKDALEHFHKWQVNNEKRYGGNALHSAIYIRLMISSLKLTMNLMIADLPQLEQDIHGTKMYITPEYMVPMTKLVDDYFMPHAISVYEMLERDASKNVQDKILSKLIEAGGEKELWRLSKDLHIPSRERDAHIEALEQSREVVLVMRKNNRKKTVWIRLWQDGDDQRLENAKVSEEPERNPILEE